MAKNDNLHKAKDAKNDEFYTRLKDIEAEISQHKDYVTQFEGKTVLCNCDDPEWSNFFQFFKLHFKQLKLKKLITTHYNKDGSPSYKLEWSGETLNDDMINLVKTPLSGNGDFRSDECIAILKEADIVVTNPPFSIARESFIPLLVEHNKKFVIIGDLNWITYKTVFPLFQENKMFFGYTNVKEFTLPDGSTQKFGNKIWFTNMDLDKHHEPLILTKNYKGNESKYPKYENYEAIECAKIKEIPKDYFGAMGVPITFLDKYSPEQFEIIGMAHGDAGVALGLKPYDRKLKTLNKGLRDGDLYYMENNVPVLPYRRILIKRKETE